MPSSEKSQEWDTGKTKIRRIIRDKLYPTERFPRTLFPDLEDIIYDHFKKTIKFDRDPKKGIGQNLNTDEGEERIQKALRFETLLQNHPQVIVLIYRRLISRYIQSKHQIPQEREDIMQEIVTRLLMNKMTKIQEQYNFNFKKNPTFTSYFMVTVRNIHIDIIRERKNKMLRTVDIEEIRQPLQEPNFELTSNKIFIDEELTKLQLILRMYYKSQPKIELCLKIKYRIRLNRDDIVQYFPHCSDDDIKTLTRDFRFKQDKQVFESIIDIFNRYEKKENKGDTLRKWIALKTEEIIRHLNHTHDCPVYNLKNIPDLFALYFQDMYSIKGDQKWT